MPNNAPEHSEAGEKPANRSFTFRLNLFFFFIFILFSILVVRLAYLQMVESSSLKQQANTSYTIDEPIPPIRGNIYDRDDYPIATTKSVQSLYYQPQIVTDKQKVVQLAYRVADLLNQYKDPGSPDMTPEVVIKNMDVGYDLQLKPTTEPYYLSSARRVFQNLNDRQMANILSNRDTLPGFEVREESVRQYDPSRVAVQLIGYLRPYNTAITNPAGWLDYYRKNTDKVDYLNDENVGLDGLEFEYQHVLRGQNGHRIYPVNSLQQVIGPEKMVPPVKGDNLVLTIQKDVQLAAQKAIADNLAYMKSGAAKQMGTPYRGHNAVAGYAVAIEVKTGAVVAMASYPDYDPNIWQGGLSTAQWQAIQHEYTNGAIMDRAPNLSANELAKHPSSLVPSGSVIKPATVLFGLKYGLITPTEQYHDTGIFYFGKNNAYSITNSDREAFGNINASQAIAHSSNVFMASMIGNRLYETSKYPDAQKLNMWDSFLKQFGLGAPTESGLPGESQGVLDYYDTAKRYSLQSAMTLAAFGQEASYTTLQLAQYAATLANHGVRMKPMFVSKITDYNNHVVKTFQPQVLNRIQLPAEDWKVIEDGMAQVNVHGFDGFKYPFLRKTGTSQEVVAGKTVDNGVLIAYEPADHPKLAVAVVVPEGGFGSYAAAPIARQIFDAYNKYVGLGN